jgi:hypothetical protein
LDRLAVDHIHEKGWSLVIDRASPNLMPGFNVVFLCFDLIADRYYSICEISMERPSMCRLTA